MVALLPNVDLIMVMEPIMRSLHTEMGMSASAAAGGLDRKNTIGVSYAGGDE